MTQPVNRHLWLVFCPVLSNLHFIKLFYFMMAACQKMGVYVNILFK